MLSGDTAELPRVRRLPRRRDVAGWLVTPLLTLVAGPVLAGLVGIGVIAGQDQNNPPAVCQSAAANGCEEATLRVLAEHAVLFAALWAALWLVPWWRGLRGVRVALAVLAIVVLVMGPMRLDSA